MLQNLIHITDNVYNPQNEAAYTALEVQDAAPGDQEEKVNVLVNSMSLYNRIRMFTTLLLSVFIL